MYQTSLFIKVIIESAQLSVTSETNYSTLSLIFDNHRRLMLVLYTYSTLRVKPKINERHT